MYPLEGTPLHDDADTKRVPFTHFCRVYSSTPSIASRRYVVATPTSTRAHDDVNTSRTYTYAAGQTVHLCGLVNGEEAGDRFRSLLLASAVAVVAVVANRGSAATSDASARAPNRDHPITGDGRRTALRDRVEANRVVVVVVVVVVGTTARSDNRETTLRSDCIIRDQRE